MAEKKATRVTYSLEREYQELFRRISKITRRSMSDELRMMLDARAELLGIPPINPVNPKSFSSILKTESEC